MLSTLLTIYITTLLNPFSSSETYFAASTETLTADTMPIRDESMISPVVEAKAAIVSDLSTGSILFEKNADIRLPIASITKLMTATIILEENNLNDVVTVTKNSASVEGTKIWLYPGEKISVQNLLYAIIIHSGNDAAYALAEFNAGSAKKFVEKMNDKAQKLGLQNTHFTSPYGFDDPQNYSNTRDLSILGRYAHRKDFIRHAAVIKNMEIKSTDGKLTHKLENTNELLGSYLKVKGLKTGSTPLAGECFISIIENDLGNEILTVVLNSPNRFQETKLLADWTFRAYKW